MCGLKAGLPRKGPWGNRLLPPDPVTWQSHMTLRGTATFQGASHTEPTKSGIHLVIMLSCLGYYVMLYVFQIFFVQSFFNGHVDCSHILASSPVVLP